LARFPKIDQPCPLSPKAQRGIKGDCGLCGKTVHCLDGKSDGERAALLRNASGPVCVSYRIAASLSAAVALSMAGPLAASPSSSAADAEPAPQTTQADTRPVIFTADPPPAQTSVAQEEVLDEDELIFVGGISRPDEAEWIDTDASLPELPMRVEPSVSG
jgi:hypothetical protein